jgi:hypothetical protein
MKQFVILEHCYRGVHWDFMLECGQVLRTWALAEQPRSGQTIQARPLPDHRLAYLEYEGPISRDRGEVKRWDRGTYTLLEQHDDRLALRLEGHTCRGTVTLTREQGGELWRFVLEQDAATTA